MLNADRKYVGFVDMLDITKAVLKAFGIYRGGKEPGESQFAAFARSESFTTTTVHNVCYSISQHFALQ